MANEIQPFFKGVRFVDLKPGQGFVAEKEPYSDSEVPLDNALVFDNVTGRQRYDRPLWTRDGIIDDFFSVLRQIRASGVRIPIEGRSVFLVSREALIPDAIEERKKLVAECGKDILDTIIGTNIKIEDGRYISRIGYGDQEHVVLPSTVMSVIAHEHGHTIGDALPIMWEDMKAYAFEGFFMSRYLGRPWDIDGTDPASMHDVARNRVAQLTQRGIDNLEILAHLADYGFGNFGPRDYSKHVGRRGRLMSSITRHSHA